MKNLLIVVDMQNDFITGALGTGEAQAILPDVVKLVESWDGPVAFTRDTHGPGYLDTQEGKHLPVPHCLKGTDGWQIAGAGPLVQRPAARQHNAVRRLHRHLRYQQRAAAQSRTAGNAGEGHRPLLRLRHAPKPPDRPGRHAAVPGGDRGVTPRRLLHLRFS